MSLNEVLAKHGIRGAAVIARWTGCGYCGRNAYAGAHNCRWKPKPAVLVEGAK